MNRNCCFQFEYLEEGKKVFAFDGATKKLLFIVAGKWRCKNSFPFSINQFNQYEATGCNRKKMVTCLHG